ncbi:hypothetical protein FALBO_13337 [Fusarium albosuccineum]|uniref:DUF7702 domain-containing protein n=1 Tax=Fusarium albosuccineum TaxID=1237068 RepID=A0A8H4P776_9HYPO|nr:hypothetical protein FALBO_13337 [Fusarium albosuccineum]
MDRMRMPGPPSAGSIDLSITALVIFGILFFPTVYITYKHGKPGMMCWPILVSFFLMRFAYDIEHILRRNEPDIPTAVTMITYPGIVVCLAYTIIGMIFEAMNLVSTPSGRWSRKAVLGVIHLGTLLGVALASLGGTPSKERPGQVTNPTIEKAGNIIMLVMMLVVLGWWWHAAQRVFSAMQETNFGAARALVIAALPGVFIQLIRQVHGVYFAFTRDATLDPITGSLGTKIILMFVPQLCIVVIAVASGWMSKNARPRPKISRIESIDIEISRGWVSA